jgi:hypothetical protein
MVSIVNGHMCYSSCQAKAARAGKDPHAPPGAPPGQSDSKNKANGPAGQTSAILDPGHSGNGVNGTNGPNAINPTGGAGAANTNYQSSLSVNLLI